MKYLRKIFENSNTEQIEEVESIFMEFSDENTDYDIIDTSEKSYIHVSIPIYDNTYVADNMDHINGILKEYENSSILLKRIKTALTRVEYLKNKWSMTISQDEYSIKIYYLDTKLTLSDAFGGEFNMRHVDINIMKNILKNDYNLTFLSSTFIPKTGSTRYSKDSYFLIRIKETISDNHQLLSDIKGLMMKSNGYDGNGPRVFSNKAFYEVKISESITTDINSVTTIKLIFN